MGGCASYLHQAIRLLISTTRHRTQGATHLPPPPPRFQGQLLIAHLQQLWVDTPVCVGDSVNVIGAVEVYNGDRHIRLDSTQGLLVLHPDVLLSGGRAV